MKLQISIERCPVHRFRAICLSGDASVGGTRLTPSKCCGRWKTEQAWTIDSERLRADIESEERRASHDA